MPELAETALFASDLHKATKNFRLRRVTFNGNYAWRHKLLSSDITEWLNKSREQSVHFSSRGKCLLLCSGQKLVLEIKLGMTGRFVSIDLTQHNKDQHNFFSLHFDNGFVAHYLDFRRFSRLKLVSPSREDFCIGGYEPEIGFYTSPDDEIRHLIETSFGDFRRFPRHTWLLKHGPKSGIGNYMANESLGRLNLSPFKNCTTETEASDILHECGKIASESFNAGGNSFAGGYQRLNGENGSYSDHCQFYKNSQVNRYKFRGRPVYTRFDPQSYSASMS